MKGITETKHSKAGDALQDSSRLRGLKVLVLPDPGVLMQVDMHCNMPTRLAVGINVSEVGSKRKPPRGVLML